MSASSTVGSTTTEDVGGGNELSASLMALLAPAISHLDKQVLLTRQSQTVLYSEMEEVAEILRHVSDSSQISMDGYARKLEDSQRRVNDIAKRLEMLTERLRQLQLFIVREKSASKDEIQAPLPQTPPR